MSKCALAVPVETAGSAWIICRSKSYINRPYYFNTLTGQAVWNLSEAEMEKSRRVQKNFVKSSFSIEDCPEPEGSPEHYLPNTMKPNNNRIMRSKVYNKQVINNRFTRTSNYSPINGMPMSIAVPTLYNPLIWNVPSQPIVLGHFNQPSSNVNTQLSVSETSIPLSKRFSSYTETQNMNPTTYVSTQNMSQFKNQTSTGTSMYAFNRTKGNVDLREKLSSRRRSFRKFESHENQVEETDDPPIYQNEETLLNMKDEDWLAKNLQKNPYSIDTFALKQLVNMEDDAGFWYIVTDTIVLLSNTNFLRVLLNDDKQCILILPQAVFEEIESISKSNLNSQANQALAFISQQIILNQAVIDQETLSNDLYVQDEILSCCSRIAEQRHPVILITNNVEILHLKDSVAYQILTMREFKTQACIQTESVKKYIPLNDIETNIKITIPNVLNEDPSKHQPKYIITDNEGDHSTIQSKVGIEEETNNMNLPAPCEQNEDDETHNDDLNNTNATDEKDISFFAKPKLNQPISQDNLKITSISSKKFKWRRKSHSKDNLNELNKFEKTNVKETTCQPSCSGINKTNIEYIKRNNVENVNITHSSTDTIEKADDDDLIYVKTEPLSPKQNTYISKDDKNVMFEIASQSMEENLKLKCDEWVSRFIQIMEEVLTQILHREPKFVSDAMPPPWTLYEATECTRKKFHDDSDIVDAANKLRNVLFDIGGSRGKVKLNISPIQYMEMYSYGVYLTDALQSAISNCEDLQIAAELLYKLLSDIQDTNADINNQDSFCNITNEDIEKPMEQGIENNVTDKNNKENNNVQVYQLKEIPNIIIRRKTQQNDKNTIERSPAKSKSSTISNELISPSKYFLRSNRTSMPQEEQTTCNSKTDFLNNLNLTRTSSVEDLEPVLNRETQYYNDKESSVSYQDNQTLSGDNQAFSNNRSPCAALDSQLRLADNQGPRKDNHLENDSFANTELIAHNSQNRDTQNNNMAEEKVVHPKIVRNFVRCIDFEEKLKKNVNFAQDVDFSYDQDYDFQSGDGYYAFNSEDYDYEYDDSQIGGDGYEFHDDYGYDEEEKQIFEEEVNDMNCFINEVCTNTKDVFTVVKDFCKKCYDVLNSSTTFDKSDTLQEAENASKSLDDICEILDSIIKREASTAKSFIKLVSINPELNCIEMSDGEVKTYREVISKSLEQGKLLKETISMIINLIKSKT